MTENKEINVGIGVVTERRSFQKILKTNVCNWKESGIIEEERAHLNVLIAMI